DIGRQVTRVGDLQDQSWTERWIAMQPREDFIPSRFPAKETGAQALRGHRNRQPRQRVGLQLVQHVGNKLEIDDMREAKTFKCCDRSVAFHLLTASVGLPQSAVIIE